MVRSNFSIHLAVKLDCGLITTLEFILRSLPPKGLSSTVVNQTKCDCTNELHQGKWARVWFKLIRQQRCENTLRPSKAWLQQMTEISYGQSKTEVLDNTGRYVHQFPKNIHMCQNLSSLFSQWIFWHIPHAQTSHKTIMKECRIAWPMRKCCFEYEFYLGKETFKLLSNW